MKTRLSADYLLGRTYLFQHEGTTLELRVVGVEPARGVRLVAADGRLEPLVLPAWIDFITWTRLHDAGVLEDS